MSFSAHQRELNKRLLANKNFDLIIIGGGINGAGVARDAASRGMSVALIEAQDFAQGTSSRSSKLIHGGIRYLENLEFSLVFEALSERAHLFEMAPHLVHPLRFMFPIYDHSRVGMFKLGLGIWLYDSLALFRSPEMHERLNAQETIERYPEVQREGLKGSYIYSDAYTDDDRLVIETLRDAERMGAVSINYSKACSAIFNQGKACGIEVRDQLSGDSYEVRGKHIISTVGPWTDIFAERIFAQWDKVLRPTKGVHLVFEKDRIPLESAVVMQDDRNSRIVFAIPRHEMLIVGTTDTDFNDDPAKVKVEEEDIEYLLGICDEYFPGAKIQRSDIVSAYAGIRPLVADGSSSEGKTSREHEIIKDERNVTFLSGGKYTTYRTMSEETVDAALESFPPEGRIKFQAPDTLKPLNPYMSHENILQAKLDSRDWEVQYRLSSEQVKWLLSFHAGEAPRILQNYYRLSDHPLSTNRLWMMQAKFAVNEMMCHNLVDFYVRRSPLFLALKDHGMEYVRDIAQVFANEFNWSNEQIREEVTKLKEFIASELQAIHH